MYKVTVRDNSTSSKVDQIVKTIALDIDNGLLKVAQRMPSINEFSKQNKVARDTIERAYKQLKHIGYIASYPSRGYFVLNPRQNKLQVLLIFNRLSSFKKIIFDALVHELGEQAHVDLQIHHYDPLLLKKVLEKNLLRYDHFIIMPHFFVEAKQADYVKIIQMVPPEKLVLLDKNVPQLNGPYKAVFQDFKMDIFEALSSIAKRLDKYKAIRLLLPETIHHPTEIVDGIALFCKKNKIKFERIYSLQREVLHKHTVYMVIDDEELAQLIKNVRQSPLSLGKDVGIIAFNETVFKELLEVTVVSTDFHEMGKTVAKLVLSKEPVQHKNPFFVRLRKSL